MLFLSLILGPFLLIAPANASVEGAAPPPFGSHSYPSAMPIHPDSANLETLRRNINEGRTHRALKTANAILAQKPRREERHIINFVAGMLYRKLGYNNLASESFTRVRFSDQALAHWGAYYEAEQDLLRGKPYVAVKECRTLHTKYPNSRFKDACERLIVKGLAASGHIKEARELAQTYEAQHQKSFIGDSVELFFGLYLKEKNPEQALRVLRRLSDSHRHPAIGQRADEIVGQLQSSYPDAIEPRTLSQWKKRANALKDSGRKVEAWTTFQFVQKQEGNDPQWARANSIGFAWKARKYTYLVEQYSKRHLEEPNAQTAWRAMSSAWRAGLWDDVYQWLKLGDVAYKDTYKWKRSHEDIGRIWMLGQQYKEAQSRFDRLAERSGSRGRRGTFLSGFADYKLKQFDKALEKFDRLIEGKRGDLDQYRYWRWKIYSQMGDVARSEADKNWVLSERPNSWYAFLIRHAEGREHPQRISHPGSWTIPPDPFYEVAGSTSSHSMTLPMSLITHSTANSNSPTALRFLSWPLSHNLEARQPANQAVLPHLELFVDPSAPTQNYHESIWFNPKIIGKQYRKLSEQSGKDWPRFSEARLLARGGYYDWSGAVFGEFFEAYTEAMKNPNHRRHMSAKAFKLTKVKWKPYFYYTRDHFNTMRHNYGTWKSIKDPKNRLALQRMHWPIAHGATVWEHSQKNKIDPYFVLAIMRAESRYDATAVSRVGALGPMQIMPRTGHLIAFGRKDIHFETASLHEPETAISFGAEFLGLLMQRFGGAFHLAAASYNGGPFAVSSWLKGTGHEMPIDEWVEHILYSETRRYVKRVSMYYQEYLDLYDLPHSQVEYLAGPYKDDANIVDY